MKHACLDTNILFDYLLQRKPFAEYAGKIIQLGIDKKVKLYTSSLSFTTLYYILRRGNSHKSIVEKLQALSYWIEILPVDQQVIQKAFTSDFRDFEDAVQNFATESFSNIKYMVTRNEKDFEKSRLVVVNPVEFLAVV